MSAEKYIGVILGEIAICLILAACWLGVRDLFPWEVGFWQAFLLAFGGGTLIAWVRWCITQPWDGRTL